MTPSARPALAWIAAATTALGMLATAAAPAQAASSVPAASTPAPSTSTAPTAAAGTQADPLDSPRWEDMRKSFFADATVVFDERVRVSGPAVAEDSLNVPVSVDASGLPAVEELIVFADFNPIVKALRFEPGAAQPRLGFRIKLQQSSPIRVAARTVDGVWRVGGTWVTTTGWPSKMTFFMSSQRGESSGSACVPASVVGVPAGVLAVVVAACDGCGAA